MHQSYQRINPSILKLHRNNLFKRLSTFKNKEVFAYANINIGLEITFLEENCFKNLIKIMVFGEYEASALAVMKQLIMD